MAAFSNVLGKTCIACGQERNKKDKIAYHPATFEPYCSSLYYCNEDHPNSPKNLALNVKDGKYLPYGEVPLLGYDEAKEVYGKWLETHHSNPEKAKKIRRMVENPFTIRIGSPELAEFILNLQDEMAYTSISDTIRFCIQRMQEEHGGFHQKVEAKKQEIREQDNLKEVSKEPVIVAQPRKVSVPVAEDDFSF